MTHLLPAILLPIAIDLATCVLALRSNRRGGPSGIPLVTLVLYGYVIFNTPTLSIASKTIAAIVSLVLHILLVFLIPYADSRMIRSVHRSGNQP